MHDDLMSELLGSHQGPLPTSMMLQVHAAWCSMHLPGAPYMSNTCMRMSNGSTLSRLATELAACAAHGGRLLRPSAAARVDMASDQLEHKVIYQVVWQRLTACPCVDACSKSSDCFILRAALAHTCHTRAQTSSVAGAQPSLPSSWSSSPRASSSTMSPITWVTKLASPATAGQSQGWFVCHQVKVTRVSDQGV